MEFALVDYLNLSQATIGLKDGLGIIEVKFNQYGRVHDEVNVLYRYFSLT